MAGARSRDGWRCSYRKRPTDPVQDGQAAARAAEHRGARVASCTCCNHRHIFAGYGCSYLLCGQRLPEVLPQEAARLWLRRAARVRQRWHDIRERAGRGAGHSLQGRRVGALLRRVHARWHPKLLRPSSSAQMRGRAATPLLSSSVLKWPQGSSRRPTSRS